MKMRSDKPKLQDGKTEFSVLFQLTFLVILTVLAMLLFLVVMISGWDRWICPVLVMGVLSCWLLYFLQIGNVEVRIHYYFFVTVLGIFYYGSKDVAITDVPIIICLMIIVLSAYRSLYMVRILAAIYPLLLLLHIFIHRDLGPGTDQLTISRLVLGGVCLGCALIISKFFFREMEREQKVQKQTELELAQAKKENEQFLANVSHELRTPINAVNGMSEIILQGELSDELRSQVTSIQRAGRRLFGQVSDILDYSELMTDRLKVSNEDYEPISVINDVVSRVDWAQMKDQLDFALDVQTDIPRALYGDAGKLKKIIAALLENTIKFTESGGGYLYVSSREESYGVNLNIDLWDTGIGMNEEQLKNIYHRLYKADAGMDKKTGGLGLGLAIVHGMVTVMGGFMSVESRLGEGTHVHVTVPQAIKNKQKSITLKNHEEYRVACYFNRDKYVRPEVAGYYDRMIRHIKEGLAFELYRADSLQELKQFLEKKDATHLFIAEWEYRMDRDYFDQIAKQIYVILFADRSFRLPEHSRIHVLQKPVYIMAVNNLLYATAPGQERKDIEEKLTFPNVRALVVDDDNMNLVVAKGILKSYGMEAETCLGGMAAIERCALEDYQIIFMDYMMPEMNGVEAMRRIRAVRKGYYKNIPIVVLTANAVSGAKEMFLSEGFDEFLAKPIEMLEMSRVLKKMLLREEY
jgi:signal transduction histidine kinase/CheY-like chemotaxis protein